MSTGRRAPLRAVLALAAQPRTLVVMRDYLVRSPWRGQARYADEPNSASDATASHPNQFELDVIGVADDHRREREGIRLFVDLAVGDAERVEVSDPAIEVGP